LDSKIVEINKVRKLAKKSRIFIFIFILIIANFSFCMVDSSNIMIRSVQAKNSPIPSIIQLSDWWNSEWIYRKEIIFNHSKIPSDLENFPVLIDIIDDDLVLKAQSDGDDIVFIDENGDKLNHELESYNNSDGNLVSWVNVTSLSSSSDTSIYMYYGNPNCDNQENTANVWNSGFEAVWHLAETTGGDNAWKDSTGNGYNGTDINMNQSENDTDFDAQGKINGAILLDGYDDSINTSLYPGDGPRTIEFWGNFDTLNGDSTVGCHDHANHRFYAGLRGENAFFGMGDTASADAPVNVSIENWYYISVVANETTASYFLNGEKITSFSYSQNGSSLVSFTIGYTNDNEHGFINGIIDEVRISYTDRSQGWISACYNNQNNSDSFYDIGIEEQEIIENHPPNKPQSPNPEDEAKDICLNPMLSVLVTDIDDDSMDVCFFDASDDSLIGVDNNVANNSRAEVEWPNLEYNTTYFWYAVANDTVFENYSIVWAFTTEDEQTEPPTISIIKPQKHRFYFRDKRLFRRLMPNPFIIGHITIKAEANDDQGIDRVEFYVDEKLKGKDFEPNKNGVYSWTLNARTIFFRHRHKITVYAIDTDNNVASDNIDIYIINFPLLHPFRG